MSREPEPSFEGRTLGEFVVRERIGAGGFGVVHRCEQPALAREAVVKIQLARSARDEALVQRFLREARVASHLDHPFAAHVYAFGAEPDGVLWIAMELVRGVPLDRFLEAQGPLPLERFIPFCERLAEVVDAAHEQGIVHRDLKPENVMVLARAGRLLPKLLDLGIAKQREPEEPPLTGASGEIKLSGPHTVDTGFTLSVGGRTFGSPRYMAPEQWQSFGDAGAPADIYALGVMSYEAITGRLPFERKTARALAVAHAHEPVPPVGEGLPEALDAVFQRVMAKRPEERPSSAGAFVAALRDAAGLAAEMAPLPGLDEELRARATARLPRPIAEAVAAWCAAKHPYLARDRLWLATRVIARWLGVVALAAAAQLEARRRRGEAASEALVALARRSLGDREWLELARELCAPFSTQPEVHPLPELVRFLAGEESAALDQLIELRQRAAEQADADPRALLEESAALQRKLLPALELLAAYPVAVPRADGDAELLMGARQPEPARTALRGGAPADRPVLLDGDGALLLPLWPLAQVAEPSPGATEELFLFDGRGRRGAKLVAMPRGFELEDAELMAWIDRSLLTADERAGAGGAEPRPPYRGLAAFSREDADEFFGREREVVAFLNRLRVQPLLVVVGPSGVGKSSFVQAGVLPALPGEWTPLAVRPGPTPMATLAAALGLGRGGGELSARTLATALRERAASAPLFLLVDQFEELFTLCHDPAERQQYAEALVRAAGAAPERLRVVITLRDDFLIRAKELAAFHEGLSAWLELLATPPPEALVRTLIEPARRAGYDFDDAKLPEEMVAATADRPGALALLSFTAAKLWELRDPKQRRLTRRSYEALGGVGGALARHAESTLAAMPPEQHGLVREAFRHLVTAEGTRALVTGPELRQVLGDDDRARQVIEALVAARLVVGSEGTAGEEWYEIIHEAFLGAWPRLADWRREEAETARLRDQLRAAARQWQERGRPSGLLWRDDVLTEYRLWRGRYPGQLTAAEEDFGRASLAEQRRGRRRRRALIVGAFVALSVGLLVLAQTNARTQRERRRAERESARAEANQAQAIARLAAGHAERGRQLFLDGDPLRALPHLVAAAEHGVAGAAEQYLVARARSALAAQQAVLDTGVPLSIAYDARGERLLVTTVDQQLSVWRVDGASRLWASERGSHLAAVFAADGSQVLAGQMGGVVAFDAATGAELGQMPAGEAMVMSLGLSARGRLLACDQSGTLFVWQRAGGPLLLSRTVGAPGACSLRVSPREEVVALSTGDQRLRLLRIDDGSELGGLDVAQEFPPAAFAADGSLLVGHGDGSVHRFDTRARRWSAHRQAHGEAVSELAVAGAAPVAVSLGGGVARAFGLPDLTPGQRFEAPRPLWNLALSDDGNRLLVTSADGTADLWQVDGGLFVAHLVGHTAIASRAAFAPSGGQVATGSGDGTVRLWRPDAVADLRLATGPAPILRLEFVSDSQLLALHGDGSGRLHALAGADPAVSYAVVGLAKAVSHRHDLLLALVDGRPQLGRLGGGGEVVPLELDPQRKFLTGAISEDGALVAGGLDDGSVGLWDRASGRQRRLITAHDGMVLSVQLSGDGRTLASASGDRSVKLWDVASGELLHSLEGHESFVFRVLFSPDGELVATACGDGTVRLFERASGELRFLLEGHAAAAVVLAFTPDGALLISGSTDGEVRVWDVVQGLALEVSARHPAAVIGLAVSPDGTRLASSGGEGGVRVSSIARAPIQLDELRAWVRCHVPFEIEGERLVPRALEPCR